MKAIYEPTGKAREFGDLACNLYRGCSNGCKYCYAPGILRMKREEFLTPSLRKGILDQLGKDAKKIYGSRIPVFLCFTCDPYPTYDVPTRTAIDILLKNKCAINILTKSGTRACRDFDRLSTDPDNWFGTTFTYWDKEKSRENEPGAASPRDRLDAIKEAKSQGIKTWVSLEPIVSAEEAFDCLYESYQYVDLFKIGKMNHRNGISEKELRSFLKGAIYCLKKNKKDYYIKIDTRPFLEQSLDHRRGSAKPTQSRTDFDLAGNIGA